MNSTEYIAEPEGPNNWHYALLIIGCVVIVGLVIAASHSHNFIHV